MQSDTAFSIIFGALGAFFFVILFAAILFGIVFYILQAIGLYRIAQRKGIDHAWLAWIPFAQTYLYAEVIGKEIMIGTIKIPQFPWAYIAIIYGTSLIAGILNVIPFFGQILVALLGPAIYVVSIYVMYRFFKLFEGENAVIYTVICAIFPFIMPIMILVLRDKPFAADAVVMKQV